MKARLCLRFGAFLLGLLLLASAVGARTIDPEQEARDYVRDKRWADAARVFGALYRERNDPKFLYNEALAREKALQYGVALRRWAEYLAVAAPVGAERVAVEGHIDNLRRYVRHHVFVRTPAGVGAPWTVKARLAGDDAAHVSETGTRDEIELMLHDGRWTVEATMEGREPWTTSLEVYVDASDRHEVALAPVKVAVAPPPVDPIAPKGTAVGPRTPDPFDDPAPIADRRPRPPAKGGGTKAQPPADTGLRAVYIGELATGGVLLVTGSILYGIGLADNLTVHEVDLEAGADAYNRKERLVSAGASLLGSGGGLLVTGFTGFVPRDARKVALWTEFGVGVAALGVGIALDVVGDRRVAGFSAQDNSQEERDEYSKRLDLRRGGLITLGAGGGLLVGSVLGLLLDGPPAVMTSFVPLEDGGALFMAAGRF